MSKFFNEIINSKYPYIIAEIGANHNGDMEIAKRMIDSAKDCGADAVKFQSWTPQSLIAQEEYDRNQSYDDSPKKHFGSLKQMVEKYYLRKEQHYDLKKYCDKLNIDFCSTPFSNDEVDLLIDLDAPFIKVASMDVNNTSLLNYIALKSIPILLSTGMSTISEIGEAIDTIEKNGNKEIVVMHCVSIYPPKNEDVNLNNLKMLEQTFGYPIGFSDHTFGTTIPLASTVLGAKIIEKHFTIDKDMPGWDHEISADPSELMTIVQESKTIIDSLGSYKRIVSQDEIEKSKKFRRSIVAARDISKDVLITRKDIAFKRPGTGIPPNELEFVIGRKVKNDLSYDQLIRWEDLV
jgi:sialic acid synthase SpsE